ncbi:MAG: hypothetical protein WCS17_06225 [Prevotella sp.]|jgi:hypothetical protein
MTGKKALTQSGGTHIPSLKEVLLMDENKPMPPSASVQTETDRSKEGQGRVAEEPVIMQNFSDPLEDLSTVIVSSPFLSALKEYEDAYDNRKMVIARRCVLVDEVVMNTIDQLSFYSMNKSNMINSMLTYCIQHHSEELRKFLRKDKTLL